MVAGCSSDPDAATSISAQETESSVPIPAYTREAAATAQVPAVVPPLESHPGDKDNFYVETDDYVVWAKPSENTSAVREYRVVSFDDNGIQALAFLKYVFANEAEATEFAKTSDLLIPVGNVVYYRGWFGPETQDRAGVIELVLADGDEHFISQP
jgi:co-chaperonin GroES (HSP10)